MTEHDLKISRRAFVSGAAGLVIALHLPGLSRAESGAAAVIKADMAGADASQFAPNAFVRIAPDDTVTVLIKHIEFGQGPYTGLSTLVAEELDADWDQMRAEAAPSNPEVYKNLAFGIQGTGGSTAMANSYMQMRQAGAAARAMLIEAAATEWAVPAGEITIEAGRIKHAASGKESGFGAFAEKAAGLTPPAEPVLKDPADFKLIGADRPRVDTLAKSTGTATFTFDVNLPDMVVSVIAHPPRFGGKPISFDDSETRKIDGVVDVRMLPQGVAVYATSTWAAISGRNALQVEWDDSGAEKRSSAQIVGEYQSQAMTPGAIAASRGDIDATLAGAAQTFEAEYVFPYLAHAPMEPLDAVIAPGEDGGIDAYLGSQLQTVDHGTIAAVTGVDQPKVRVHTQYAGGSFGRRAQPTSHFAAEAASAYMALGGNRPVKHVWTRENDIRGGWYRPIYVHRLKGGLDADGNIIGWDQTIVGQSIMAGSPFEAMIQDGIDPTSVEGARDLPYSVDNFRVSLHSMPGGVPVLWWRSVGHTHTGYTTETFIDEMLAAAGRDPVEGRLKLLADHPRHAGALKAAAQLADWGSAVPEGRARGVAVHKSFDTYVAQIVEISIGEEGYPRVHKVWCGVDCGVAVNPNIIRAQLEGGIGYGVGAVLYSEITLGEGGIVDQENFDTYRSIRINEMPEVEVAIVPSTENPTGIGEPGVPPVGPAVANAWRLLTGETARTLLFKPLAS